MRIGWGFDAHRIGGDGPMIVCGVIVDEERGLLGHSDADVGFHAISDAILGAAALGDMGQYFPSSDPKWADADSADLLRQVVSMVDHRGIGIASVDVTLIAEKVRFSPHRQEMRQNVAELLLMAVNHVSVKATSTDGMGYLGRDEGVAATVVVALDR